MKKYISPIDKFITPFTIDNTKLSDFYEEVEGEKISIPKIYTYWGATIDKIYSLDQYIQSIYPIYRSLPSLYKDLKFEIIEDNLTEVTEKGHVVFKATVMTTGETYYFKFTGYGSSFEQDCELDDGVEEVIPTPVTVIQYLPKP